MYTPGRQLSINEHLYIIPLSSQAWVQESLGPICTPEQMLSVHVHFYNFSLKSSLVISYYPNKCETSLGVSSLSSLQGTLHLLST